MKKALIISAALMVILHGAACDTPTYPKERLRESVIELCEKEYGVKVDAELSGKTLAIYLPVENLFGITLNLSESAQDKIQNALLIASRVVLSTDADIQFYCVITQDTRIPEIQLVVIKYVDDVKRAFYYDISRDEYYKRTLIDISENPQAKKEKTIKDVFGKMDLDPKWQEKVLEDFFRSQPTSLEGIGYWNGKFYLKDITLGEFLAEQMASRINMRFREKESLKKFALKSVNGKFMAEKNPKFFLITFIMETLLFAPNPEQKAAYEKEVFGSMADEISQVIYNYKFKDFNFVEILEKTTNKKLFISKEDVYFLKTKKLTLESITGTIK